jgi:CheY-like chemotaxis protein
MTQLSREVARHLPFMRRYARAVVGDQLHGDECVRSTLQRLLSRPNSLEGSDLRIALYRSLHDVWAENGGVAAPAPASAGAGPIDEDTILASRLGNLSARKRQALVLTTLEGFHVQQAAAIMRLTSLEMMDLLELAREDLRAQKATKILIIEDEPIIALDIATTVERNGHTVVGIATTHAEAVALARRDPPGLILADIQLQDDSSGIEAVQEILSSAIVPVIFVTAFPERLLTGERPEPAFLITKPFDPDTLNVSISQALAVVAVDKA